MVDIIGERGAATKGRAASLTAGAHAVEIKATIPPKQVKAALKKYGLDPSGQETRYIYFFDTQNLDLFKRGIIARARRRVGGIHDSTIKFRPINPSDVPKRWEKYRGFKIESDASDKGIVTSGSLTMPVEKGLIKKVAAGAERIGLLFTEEQVLFLLSIAHRTFDPTGLVVLGPVEAFRWRIEDPAIPWPLTAELWKRPDRAQIMEISIKAPVVQAAVAYFGFMAYLAEAGAERDNAQQAKTRWALQFFVDRTKRRSGAKRRTSNRASP